jgi:hypothetical protein
MCSIYRRAYLNARLGASIQAAHDAGVAPYTPVTLPEGCVGLHDLHGMTVLYAGTSKGRPLIGVKNPGSDLIGTAPLGTVEPLRFAVQLKHETMGCVLCWGTRYTHHRIISL